MKVGVEKTKKVEGMDKVRWPIVYKGVLWISNPFVRNSLLTVFKSNRTWEITLPMGIEMSMYVMTKIVQLSMLYLGLLQ